MPVIAVGMHKGGTAKTTTTINLAAGLADRGHRVLAIDTDPQAQLALGLGVAVRADRTLVQVLFDGLPVEEAVVKVRGFELIPSHDDLNSADVDLSKEMDGWTSLKRALDSSRDRYDFILIDTPPHLGMLTANALAAADFVLIPVETQQAAYDQLRPFVNFVEKAQKRLNKQLQILGIVPTKYTRRQLLDEQILGFLRENPWKFQVFEPIRRSTHVGESFSVGKPVVDHSKEAWEGGYGKLVEAVAATLPATVR